jgi:hypothetical protein
MSLLGVDQQEVRAGTAQRYRDISSRNACVSASVE